MTHSSIPAVILAGGQARRIGGDKPLMTLAGQSLLSHVLHRLTPQAAPILLSANGDLSRFSGFDLPVVADDQQGFLGPLAGVLSGMDWAADLGASHVVSVACDGPFLPVDFVRRLAEHRGGAPVVLAASAGPNGQVWRQPTYGLWPVAVRDDLRAALAGGLRKMGQFVDQLGCVEVVFRHQGIDPFFNINTAADLNLAEDHLAQSTQF